MDRNLNGYLMAERVARLETEVKQILSNQTESREAVSNVNDKLDELLALKNKGMGAFWLASALAGTGIVSFFWWFIDTIKEGLSLGL